MRRKNFSIRNLEISEKNGERAPRLSNVPARAEKRSSQECLQSNIISLVIRIFPFRIVKAQPPCPPHAINVRGGAFKPIHFTSPYSFAKARKAGRLRSIVSRFTQ